MPSTSTSLILLSPSTPPVLFLPARAQSTAEQPERAAESDSESKEEEDSEEEEEEGTVSHRTTETFGPSPESSATVPASAEEGLTTALTS